MTWVFSSGCAGKERVTVTTSHISSGPSTPEEQHPPTHLGTIRTEEYKRDLAEFQARRSAGQKDLQETPVKKKCGRHSLPVSCTDCTGDPDTTFNYEKKSAIKYKKKTHKRTRSANSEEKTTDGVPNIQFLFQNQVFMPGNLFGPTSFSDPQKSKRSSRQTARRSSEIDCLIQKQIDFKEDDQQDSPPMFLKNNSLPFDVKNFLDGTRSDDEVDGTKEPGDVKSSQSSSESLKEVRSDGKLWEVMGDLKQFDRWADENLHPPSENMSKSEDNKSETSAYGLPIASSSNLDVTETSACWSRGRWGVVPVQIKKLQGVTIEHVKRKRNTEINILRKCRHPNIILLMGLYPDVQNNVHIICERCVDTLYGILHVQGRILSAQTSVHYALDVANALVFLRMQGYIHTELNSTAVMVTAHDTAKLADLSACVPLPCKHKVEKEYQLYSPEPQYVNIEDTRDTNQADCEPLLSQRSSEAYISANAVPKDYKIYSNSEYYHWQAPELFEPNEEGMVYPCSRSDVYSLCLILWECCNASLPWKSLSYPQLKELYGLWSTGVRLPQDGTYPGALLALLRRGLALSRDRRPDLAALQRLLHDARSKLDEIEYIIIPARLSKKKSNFSTQEWDATSPTDSECQSPKADIEHKAVVHGTRDSSTESEKDSKSDASPLYETIRKINTPVTFGMAEKCFLSDGDQSDNQLLMKYDHLQENECSSACSTPLAKLHARVKDLETPGMLHRSDSTEYCSILSPDTRHHFGFNNDSSKDQSSIERPTAKLSRSFTPKSYKPLHIKVPEFNLDSIKSLIKDQSSSERSSYNFDIKNYSLPTTPIARSNKLRKNAWLSGDLNVRDRSTDKLKDICVMSTSEGNEHPKTDTLASSTESAKEQEVDSNSCKEFSICKTDEQSPESVDTVRDSITGLRRVSLPHDFSSPETDSAPRTNSWSFKSSSVGTSKYKIEDDILANVNVKPLVAIHERWIYEANRKSGRSMSLPEDNSPHQGQALKPASHCVDTLQKSLPQLYKPRHNTKTFRARPASPCVNGGQWDQYNQAREAVSKNINITGRDDRYNTYRKDSDKGTPTEESSDKELKVDQSTDTRSIEEFIRDLIRKEFQHLLHEISDEASETVETGSRSRKTEDLFNRGVANVLESLKNEDEVRKEPVKSFSRVKINGNNKPLLQITFSRSGENSLQVLDNCVNVTICEPSGGTSRAPSAEDTLTEDVQTNSLKRCQAFSAIQEARSTEDLYIDDDLSTQMQENFGGRVKLIPLHGSLHEILCEREDDCCLLKVKQENGCDTIYFRCDTSDTESRDAIDGRDTQDTVVFKRSISLVEERIQRVFPKEKRVQTPVTLKKRDVSLKSRPKSEVFVQNISNESRVMSSSTPSLFMKDDKGDVEVNIENVMCYQDSSSDECLKCQVENDDFELLEREIERDIAVGNMTSLTCGCLEKISEENLSVLNEETVDRN
ncbi:uncharacterized protein [Epargyreus clarus]|uniref:uncharacterized protein isoform X2 n=1 Tax=Epargyreus clarus TaxID=520877 RepID=UPI003C2BCCA6